MLFRSSDANRPPNTPSPATTVMPAAIVAQYQKTLNDKIDNLNIGGLWKSSFENIQSKWAGQGWLTAGAWFNTIARAQGAVLNGAEGPMPIVHPPDLSGARNGVSFRLFENIGSMITNSRLSANQLDSIYDSTRTALAQFNQDVISNTKNDGASLAATGLPTHSTEAEGGVGVSALLGAVDTLGHLFGVWKDGDALAFKFNKTANPLAELAYMGYQNVSLGLNLIAWGGISSFGAAIAGAGIGFSLAGPGGSALGAMGLAALREVAGGLIGVVMLIGVLFVSTGLTLAFILPLLPFIKFFFGAVSWFLSLFEAVVSVPLWALAHVTPHGEGLSGDMAKQGYFFILSIFLRPVLMVFGLVAGLLLFFVAINFLNMTYNLAVAGSGSSGGSLAVVAKIVYSVMYAVMAYTCANSCFKAIHFFPEHGMGWMNSRGVSAKDMGDPQALAGVMTTASAYFGEKAASQLGHVGSGVGRIGQSGTDQKRANQQLSQARTDAARHRQEDQAHQAALLGKLDQFGGNMGNGGNGGNIAASEPSKQPNEPHYKESEGGIQVPLTKEDRRRDPIESKNDFSGTNTSPPSSNIDVSGNLGAAKRDRDKT